MAKSTDNVDGVQLLKGKGYIVQMKSLFLTVLAGIWIVKVLLSLS